MFFVRHFIFLNFESSHLKNSWVKSFMDNIISEIMHRKDFLIWILVVVVPSSSSRFNIWIYYFMFQENNCLYSHIRWGEAFVIVYSVTCKQSFQEARGLLKQLADLRLPSYFTALLLGNKRDLDHARLVHPLYSIPIAIIHGRIHCPGSYHQRSEISRSLNLLYLLW